MSSGDLVSTGNCYMGAFEVCNRLNANQQQQK